LLCFLSTSVSSKYPLLRFVLVLYPVPVEGCLDLRNSTLLWRALSSESSPDCHGSSLDLPPPPPRKKKAERLSPSPLNVCNPFPLPKSALGAWTKPLLFRWRASRVLLLLFRCGVLLPPPIYILSYSSFVFFFFWRADGFPSLSPPFRRRLREKAGPAPSADLVASFLPPPFFPDRNMPFFFLPPVKRGYAGFFLRDQAGTFPLDSESPADQPFPRGPQKQSLSLFFPLNGPSLFPSRGTGSPPLQLAHILSPRLSWM